MISLSIHLYFIIHRTYYLFFKLHETYLLTLPLFAGVSRIRALSPAWTGSHARETLISRTHLFLPHNLPPAKKSSTIKSWPTFCDQYFWKFPIWNSRADEKRREIRMVKVFKWYPVIDLFDTFAGKFGSWRLIKVLMIIQQLSTDWQLIGDKEVGLWHTLWWLEVW